MTLETQVADLVTATTALTAAVNVQKTTLDNSVAAAQAQAVASSNSASSVTVAAATAAAQVSLAATSASQAAANAAQAAASWVAATANNESLGAVTTTEHSGAVVAVLKPDMTLDSDGAAYRERTKHLSYYNEPLNSVWLGKLPNAAAAWALPNSATGAFFQNTSDGKFYTLGASSPAVTETFRGNSPELPASPEFIAESGRVIVYDGDKPDRPMWMVIKAATNVGINSSQPITSIAYVNGKLWIGLGDRLSVFDFVADKMFQIFSSAAGCYTVPLGIASRHASISSTNMIYTGNTIVSAAVNSIAVTVLPDAPIDLATGLQVPTVAVGTAAGTSIINSNGTVANKTFSGNAVSKVLFDKRGGLWACFTNGNAGAYAYYADLTSTSSSLPAVTHCNQAWAGTWDVFGTQPKVATVSQNSLVIGSNSGVNLVVGTGNLRGVNSMTALINTAYNTGWLVGDNRACLLCDTVAETISASGELVTNGTNPANTAGWSQNGTGSPTLTVNGSNQFVANSGSATNVLQSQAVATVVGKTYYVSFNKISTEGLAIYAGTTFSSNNVGASAFSSGSGVFPLTFQATATTTYIAVVGAGANATGTLNNISCQLATPDRSVKNKGAILYGSLTKTLAGGVSAYSGWSATNYFEQPYNSDLDSGTGDFHYCFWVNHPTGSKTTTAFLRRTNKQGAGVGTSGYLTVSTNVSGNISFSFADTSNSSNAAVSSAALQVGGWDKVEVVRRGGIALEIWINGALSGTATCLSTINLSTTDQVMEIGATNFGGVKYGSGASLAMVRYSQTAPTAAQIAFAYEQERKMFLPGAVVTLAGSSSSITALDFDATTDMWHALTSYGRTGFCGLMRVDSEATTVGTPTAISAGDGVILFGGSTGSKVYQPAYFLREEFKRKELAAKALGKIPVFFDFDAAASQTAFVVPKGYTVKAVYSAGTLKRVGTTKDYLMSFDGFSETVTFNTGLSLNIWVSIMCVRA